MRVKIMEEAIFDPSLQDFRPALVWGYDEKQILISSLPTYTVQRTRYLRNIADAQIKGESLAHIWDYWAEDGGDGYYTMRAKPYYATGDSLVTIMGSILAQWQSATPKSPLS